MKQIVIVIPFLLLAACHREEPKFERPMTPVRVTPADVYQPKAGGRYSASIMPGRQVSLAFRVSGLVTDIHRVGSRGLEPGDIVAGGTMLAHIREDDYRNTTVQAQSQLETAREAQKSARAQLAQAGHDHLSHSYRFRDGSSRGARSSRGGSGPRSR